MGQRGRQTGFPGIEDSSNILVLVPALDENEDDACRSLLTATEPGDENLLGVTFTGSPDDRLDVWRRNAGDALPANTAVVSVGEERRSVVTARIGSEDSGEQVALDFVSDPGDLTGLGVRITERLGRWEGDDRRTVACFHSLTALLQYADLERAYRFLHVLTGHFSSSDTVAHFHMDPGAHDEQTVNTIKTLMDAVITLDDDEWDVSTR